jgi:carbon storage regulator
MLVLSRKPGEKIVLGGNITLTVVEVRGNQVRLAFEAPDDVRILRGELVPEADEQPDDPDLKAKPAEWRGVSAETLRQRWRARQDGRCFGRAR